MSLHIAGKLRIGKWQEAWYLSGAYLMLSFRSETKVLPVLAATWRRSERTDWVWRLRGQEYKPNTFGGHSDLTRGGGWGRELFETEIEAWAYAVGWYRTTIRNEQTKSAERIEAYAIELGEVVAELKLARLRHAEAAAHQHQEGGR